MARQREEGQKLRDPAFDARFPGRPGDSPGLENPPMQEHQLYSTLTHTTLPAPASVALPEAVYAGHARSDAPITFPGTMQTSNDETPPHSLGK